MSPTIPMPPPGEPSEFEISQDRLSVTMWGKVSNPGSRVLAENATTGGQGVFREAGGDGSYQLTVNANLTSYEQNAINLWVEWRDDRSSSLLFLVPPDCALPLMRKDGGEPVSSGVKHRSSCADLFGGQSDFGGDAEPDAASFPADLDSGGSSTGDVLSTGAEPPTDASPDQLTE